jgi:hypothetical protein
MFAWMQFGTKCLPKISHLLRAHLYVSGGAYLSNSYNIVVNISIFLFSINLEIKIVLVFKT